MLRTQVDLISNTENQKRDEDEVIEVVMNIHALDSGLSSSSSILIFPPESLQICPRMLRNRMGKKNKWSIQESREQALCSRAIKYLLT